MQNRPSGVLLYEVKMTQGPTDQHLLVEYQAGDLNAFETLYGRHAKALLAYALGMLGDRNDAEEVLQRVFVAFARRCPRLPGNTNVKAYLFASARNSITNMRRDRNRADTFARDYEVFARLRSNPQQHADAGLEAEETRLRLNGALARLPDEQREVVLLHTQGGLTFSETAFALGLPGGTVVTRYRAAIRKLRELLSHE